MGTVEWYLCIVNALGILLYLADMRRHRRQTEDRLEPMDIPVMVFGLLGAAPGMLLVLLLADRKSDKKNMLVHVWTICITILWILVLALWKHHADGWNFNVISYLKERKWLLYYWALISVVTFVCFWLDKARARKNGQRIPIVVLLGLGAIGGGLAGWGAMYLFRHKTKKAYFTVGMPLLIVVHITALFFAMNFRL